MFSLSLHVLLSAWVLWLQLKTAGLRLLSRLSSTEGDFSGLSRVSLLEVAPRLVSRLSSSALLARLL